MSEIIIKKKVIILGANAVGKTSILNNFLYRKFDTDYKATLGVNILAKDYIVEEKITVGFSFWDMGGQKLFRNIYPRFFSLSNAAMIVFDVTRMDSFDDIINWHNSVLTYIPEQIPILLIGNKIDLADQRVVPSSMAQDLAKQYQFHYIETSAKTGENVNLAFKKLAEIFAKVFLAL
jgi:Ras-related protein Rab-6A